MRPESHRRRPGRARRILLTAATLACALAFLLPLLSMLSTSLKPADQAMERSLRLLPSIHGDDGRIVSALSVAYWRGVGELARRNYSAVWEDTTADFPLYLKNSLLVALLSVSGMVITSAIVAFGFSRLRWPGRDALFVVVLATMMVPFAVLMAPSYLLMRQLGWIGTLLPLWAPAWCGGAFSIFLLRQFFLTIPRELDEAARIDGCSSVGLFVRVILPLSRPALAVVALLHFVYSWNDFVGPLIFLNHAEQYTLPLGLQMYQSQHGGTPWNLAMAASVLVIVPVLVVFALAHRMFVEGIATQGLKE